MSSAQPPKQPPRPQGSGATQPPGSRQVIYAALLANFAIAVSKFLAAAFTGSAAMLAEGVHSLVDTGNEFLLMIGIRRSKRAADEWHPFGYGKILYFWSFIVAVSVFSLGGGISIYHGLASLRHPLPLEDPTWNYIVLGVAAIFEGYSWHVSRQALASRRRRGESIWKVVKRSKDPSVFTVFIEDSTALIGIVIALLGIWLSHALGNRYIDPAASVVIGTVLLVAALFLARETGSLLVGESIDHALVAQLMRAIAADPAVETVGHLLTMQMGPDDILLVAEVRFRHGLDIDTVRLAISRLENAIKANHPAIRHIYFGSSGLQASAPPSENAG